MTGLALCNIVFIRCVVLAVAMKKLVSLLVAENSDERTLGVKKVLPLRDCDTLNC